MEEMTNPTAQSDSVGLAALSAGLVRCLAEENADSNLVFSPFPSTRRSPYWPRAHGAPPRTRSSASSARGLAASSGRSITPLTRFVLGNAIYFKGKWDEPFNKKCTRNSPFYRLDGSDVDVPFMESGSSQFIAVHDGFKVLKLRYQMAQAQGHAKMSSDRKKRKKVSSESDGHNHTQFSMCIFLPDARDGLPDLIDTIANQRGFLHEHLPKKKVKVNKLQLPRFKLSFESSIVTILSKLGLEFPFSDEADLSRMVECDKSSSPLVVDKVIHEAVIEVNEEALRENMSLPEGTEAAAITVVPIVEHCANWPRPPRGVDFVANHPFAYFIVEEATDAVVFAGHVLDPLREN
ncbi:hypothetical protein ACQ4PT_025090 [Festuca glaucescens]